MADIFWDGFDKYGPLNQTITAMAPGLLGDWAYNQGQINIVAGRFFGSLAINLIQSGNDIILTRNLVNNYSRLIGGVAIQSNLNRLCGINFYDAGTIQCSVGFNSSGNAILTRPDLDGTVLAQGSAGIGANSWHYLEWDITFGPAAAFTVWLDGVQQFSGTGNTQSSSNGSANIFGLRTKLDSANFDDLYLFDSTGSTNNAQRGDSRVETLFPTADAAVAFTPGSGVIGAYYNLMGQAVSVGGNVLYLRKFMPAAAGSLGNVCLLPASSGSAANFLPVLYADNAGVPGALLTSGASVAGAVAGTPIVMPLTTPQTLTAGTAVWLGYLGDSNINQSLQDNSTQTGYTASVTYANGAPATAPAMSANQSSLQIWGTLTGIATNFTEVGLVPPGGDLSYVASSTAGQEDRYAFGSLSSGASNIAGVKISALARKTDGGARTVSLQVKSGSVEASSGNTLTPTASYTYLDAYFDQDPNTSAAWTAAGVNALTAGIKIVS